MSDPSQGQAEFVGKAKTRHLWPLVIASRYNIPYLLYNQGTGHNICGEVYSVDEPKLKQLDILEGYPEYYDRFPTPVTLLLDGNDNQDISPWIYFLVKFRPSLLQKPFLSDYDTNGEHGLRYVERFNRTLVDYNPTHDVQLSQ
jgi:gamma-glutamylaminecyclotransferase